MAKDRRSWDERLFGRLPQEGFIAGLLGIVFWVLFMIIHTTFCALSALGLVEYEYYHGKRIKWRRKTDDD
jgi:hypothetical protein